MRRDRRALRKRARPGVPPRRRVGDGFYAGDQHDLFPHRRLTKTAFTFELSDHLPLWAELRTRT